jgi:hypothetical protein
MHTALDQKYNVQSISRQVQLQMELQKVYRKYEETFATTIDEPEEYNEL